MDTAAQPVSAQVVGNAFVQQYYQILHQSPEQVHKFYKDISKLGRPEKDGTISVTSTMNAINDKILSLNDDDYRAEISSVDAQDSYEGGVHVLVTGYLTRKDGTLQNFAQTFFLAPQEVGFFVLNDILRYLEVASIHAGNHARASEVVVVSVAPEPNHPPVVENRIPEQSSSSAEVYKPPENGDVPVIVAEEVPVPEVVDEVQDDSHMVVEPNTKIEVVSKKSYASIVKHLKESAAKFSPPPAPPKPLPKSQDQVNQPIASGTDGHNVVENVNSQNGEADSYSVYIKGLPLNTTYDMLHDEFKKFGPIKDGGIQVRNNKGFVFGFVEFEVASAVEKAIEASPIVIGGRQAVVEEKRSTYSGGNTRGRFIPARSSGMRGRGSYGGGRGYRSGNRNSPVNRGDGYQSADTTSSSRGDSTLRA
ncbi:RNA metabolism protein [Lithospermum erythrorhizon]|uniref:RNA metabolism protein n=1 Tax=Lithospermum erythrorhizon TaxID=34254 RepID=A0AAV3R5J7_LITER